MEQSVHPLSGHPNKAWKKLTNSGQKYRKVNPTTSPGPKPEDYVRFVCISDTHSKTDKMAKIPAGDVLLHAGDFTKDSTPQEFDRFNKWIGSQPHKHKIVIAGNHEMVLDSVVRSRSFLKYLGLSKASKDKIVQSFTNYTYLEDISVNIMGYKIYGSPWQPSYRFGAFTLDRGQDLFEKWRNIPNDVDILLTHTPPLGYGDSSANCGHAGCVDLLHTVQQRVKPLYHVFGHIHEGYGVYTDNVTTFINASICTSKYKPTNLPIVFDLPKPKKCKTSDEDELRNCVETDEFTHSDESDIVTDGVKEEKSKLTVGDKTGKSELTDGVEGEKSVFTHSDESDIVTDGDKIEKSKLIHGDKTEKSKLADGDKTGKSELTDGAKTEKFTHHEPGEIFNSDETANKDKL